MSIRKFDWQPPVNWLKINTIDMHTGGEPLRVFMEGLPEIKGDTILEKRKYFRENLDYIRTGTMYEPRGHADMYGAVLTEPVSDDADLGVFFMHNEGYSTMCGHAMIALGKLLIETGMFEAGSENPEICIDAPPGQVRLSVNKDGNRVISSAFINVPSFVLYRNQSVPVAGIGRINFDVAYGGAFYAIVQAKQLGLSLGQADFQKTIDFGRRIKQAVADHFKIKHPFEEDLGFLYGTIFVGDPHDSSHHSRNACVFANGELDRSPTGSGLSARAALHHANGELEIGEKITVESILGTTMDVEIVDVNTFGPHPAVIPEVSGTAHFTGKNEFWFDPADPLKKGFILR
ncbi:MAG: proline racemase family protein [Bacteroidales bacterium]